jgi:hypothetical protein
LGGHFYSTGSGAAWVHLYAQGTARLEIDGHPVQLHQVTNYPWDGTVKVEVGVAAPQAFTLHLRVPGWCEHWRLRLNGTPLPDLKPASTGYLAVEREWRPGEVLEYEMDMPVQIIWAHPAVHYLQGRLALQRGPLVYCLEGVDHGGIGLDRIALDPEHMAAHEMTVEHQQNLLGGVSVLRGQGQAADEDGWEGVLYRRRGLTTRQIDITAIPYYAWDNRAAGAMRVWIPRTF